MNYYDGKKINMGDRIELFNQGYGTVVCSIDDGEYSDDFNQNNWGHLEIGIILKMDNGNIIYCSETDKDLRYIENS